MFAKKKISFVCFYFLFGLSIKVQKRMPAVAYYSDDDTEQYTNLLFTELVHERLLEQEGRDVVESDPNLDFM